MDWTRITRYFIVAAILLVAAYDALAMLLGGQQATISWQVQDNATALLLLGVGILIGHLFWPQRVKE